jgi:hypothetical protein
VYNYQNDTVIVQANKGKPVIIIEEKMYDEKVNILINENSSVLYK